MFLNSYLNANSENQVLIDDIYEKIVLISRNKSFYTKLSVPDTIDGRFDLLVLFSVIVIFFTMFLSLNVISKTTKFNVFRSLKFL